MVLPLEFTGQFQFQACSFLEGRGKNPSKSMPRHSIFSKVWISSSLNQPVRVENNQVIEFSFVEGFFAQHKRQTFLGEMIDWTKKIHIFSVVTQAKSARSCMFTCVGDHAFPLVKTKKLLPDWNFQIWACSNLGRNGRRNELYKEGEIRNP